MMRNLGPVLAGLSPLALIGCAWLVDVKGGQSALVERVLLPPILGATTAVMLFIGKSFLWDTLIPLYRDHVAQNHRLDGTWKASFASKVDPSILCEETIYIEQTLDHVSGEIEYKEGPDGNNTKAFRFKGTYEDGILVATYINKDRRQIGRGCFTLVASGAEGGTQSEQLKGKYSWFEPELRQAESDDYTWERAVS